jgi:hypothetical protein
MKAEHEQILDEVYSNLNLSKSSKRPLTSMNHPVTALSPQLIVEANEGTSAINLDVSKCGSSKTSRYSSLSKAKHEEAAAENARMLAINS